MVGLRDEGLNGCHLEPTHASGQPCTVFGHTLGLESDGTEQWCNSIAEIHEHTVGEVPLSKGPLVRNPRWMIGGLLPLETRTFCLECSGSRRHPWPTKCLCTFLPKESGQDRQGFLEGLPRPDNSEARECVRQESSSSDVYKSTDVAEGYMQSANTMRMRFPADEH